jgi:hypothetical protein
MRHFPPGPPPRSRTRRNCPFSETTSLFLEVTLAFHLHTTYRPHPIDHPHNSNTRAQHHPHPRPPTATATLPKPYPVDHPIIPVHLIPTANDATINTNTYPSSPSRIRRGNVFPYLMNNRKKKKTCMPALFHPSNEHEEKLACPRCLHCYSSLLPWWCDGLRIPVYRSG